MRKREYDLTKEDSKMLYGVAIVLMLYHHMFCDSTRLNCEYLSVLNVGNGYDIELKLAWFAKLCVALYSFITGYGVFHSLKGISTNNIRVYLAEGYNYVIKHWLKFMKCYWIVFIIFVPMGYLTPGSRNHDIDAIYLILDFLGMTNKFNGEWWYVLEYTIILMCAPVVNYILSKIKVGQKGILLLAGIVVVLFFTALHSELGLIGYLAMRITKSRMIIYLLVFLVGFICSKWDIFNMFYDCEVIHKYRGSVAVLFLFICIVFRVFIVQSPIDSFIDVFIVAPIVWSICRILDFKCFSKMKEVFIHLGKYSVYMWLTHTFFCYYYFQEFITITKISTLMFIQLLVVTYVAARLLKNLEFIITGIVNGKS